MKFFEAHRPHFFGLITAIIFYSYKPSFVVFFLSWLIFSILIALLIPDRWVRAIPTADKQADAAIIFGFGYVMDADVMLPGAANNFMVDWLTTNRPGIKTVLAQEGAGVCFKQRRREGKLPDDLKVIDLHEHKPGVYVNSADVAEMAVPIMHSEGIHRVLVIAHHLQLKRAAGNVLQVMRKIGLECEVVVPDLPDVPFPGNSSQWHSRCKWRYKLVELLLSRPRDYRHLKFS